MWQELFELIISMFFGFQLYAVQEACPLFPSKTYQTTVKTPFLPAL